MSSFDWEAAGGQHLCGVPQRSITGRSVGVDCQVTPQVPALAGAAAVAEKEHRGLHRAAGDHDRSRFHMDVCCIGTEEGYLADEARSYGADILMCPKSVSEARCSSRS